MICCERVYTLTETGNKIIINAFHKLHLPKFPNHFGPITLMYTVTEGHGVYEMQLTLTHLASGRLVKTWDDRYRVVDPLSLGDVMMVLRNIEFEEPGKYLFELKCNGEPIGSMPFHVALGKPPPRKMLRQG